MQDLHAKIDLIVTSPLTRTLETTLRAYGPAIQRDGLFKVVCLPQLQEVNDYPCDTGSSRESLEAHPEFSRLDFSTLTPEWTGKRGLYDPANVSLRAQWVRQWLFARPEKCIVVVSHGDMLRNLISGPNQPSGYGWRNAEVREFGFMEGEGGRGECWLDPEGAVAVAGGYDLTSSEIAEEIDGGVDPEVFAKR